MKFSFKCFYKKNRVIDFQFPVFIKMIYLFNNSAVLLVENVIFHPNLKKDRIFFILFYELSKCTD